MSKSTIMRIETFSTILCKLIGKIVEILLVSTVLELFDSLQPQEFYSEVNKRVRLDVYNYNIRDRSRWALIIYDSNLSGDAYGAYSHSVDLMCSC